MELITFSSLVASVSKLPISFLSLRVPSRVLSPPTSPTRRWVSGLPTPPASRPRRPSYPLPSSTRWAHWSPTPRWPRGTRAPPRRGTHWEPSPQEPETVRGRELDLHLKGWTLCLSTPCLVSERVEESLCITTYLGFAQHIVDVRSQCY